MPASVGTFADRVAYVTLRLIVALAHVLGVRVCYALARAAGALMFRFDRRHRRRAIRHLELSFPDWPADRIRRTARRALQAEICVGIELLWTTRLIHPHTWRRHVHLRDMDESVRRLLGGRPMIFLTGHFGNWEVVGYTMATLGFPTFAVARLLHNPYINEYITGIRERTGLIILDKRGVAARIDELLAGGQVVCFVADQDAGRKGCFVDFFGRKASTYKSIALMAAQHNVPVAVGYGKRLDMTSFRFEIGVQRIIEPAEWADRANPVPWITQAYTHALEQAVRSAPEQYIWLHRRWKTRPKGEPPADADGVA